ncbi:MAG: hypothetical protein U0521_07720 [Anaerolineae bacterium]
MTRIQGGERDWSLVPCSASSPRGRREGDIIGQPIEHSLSPAMHNAAFAALGMDWQYDKMAIPPDIVS